MTDGNELTIVTETDILGIFKCENSKGVEYKCFSKEGVENLIEHVLFEELYRTSEFLASDYVVRAELVTEDKEVDTTPMKYFQLKKGMFAFFNAKNEVVAVSTLNFKSGGYAGRDNVATERISYKYHEDDMGYRRNSHNYVDNPIDMGLSNFTRGVMKFKYNLDKELDFNEIVELASRIPIEDRVCLSKEVSYRADHPWQGMGDEEIITHVIPTEVVGVFKVVTRMGDEILHDKYVLLRRGYLGEYDNGYVTSKIVDASDVSVYLQGFDEELEKALKIPFEERAYLMSTIYIYNIPGDWGFPDVIKPTPVRGVFLKTVLGADPDDYRYIHLTWEELINKIKESNMTTN